MNYLEEFVKILAGKVKEQNIKEETELKNLGVDSLDLVEIIMDVEEKYGITFTNEELNSFVTVGDVVKVIEGKMKK